MHMRRVILPLRHELALGQLFRRLIEVVLLLCPLWWVLLFPHGETTQTHVAPGGRTLLALVTASVATLAGTLCWRAYRVSGEVFLRRLTVAFLAAAVADYMQLGDFLDPAQSGRIARLFGPFGRFQLVAGLYLALSSAHLPAEIPRAFGTGRFWRATALWVIWSSLVLLALSSAPLGIIESVRLGINILTVAFTLLVIVAGIRRHQDTPAMNALLAAMLLFAQSAVIMLWADIYSYFWWLSLIVCIGAYLVLGHGLVSEFLITRSVTGAFSIGRALQRLSEQKASAEARLAEFEYAGQSGRQQALPAEAATTSLEHLKQRMEAELARSRASGMPLLLFGFAIARWESVILHYSEDVLRSVRQAVAERLRPAQGVLDIYATDGQVRFFLLCPEARPEELETRFECLHGLLTETPYYVGSFALFLEFRATVVFANLDGSQADELLAVCNRRLDLAEHEELQWCSTPGGFRKK